MESFHMPPRTRRAVLKTVGVTGAVGIAGCMGDEEESPAFVGPDGQVTLTIVYAEGSEPTETTAQFVGQQLEQLGFEIDFESVSFDRLLAQYVQNQYVGEGEPAWSAGPHNAGPREETESQREWDLMYGIAFNAYPRAPASIDSLWLEQGPTNYYGYVPSADLGSMFADFRQTIEYDDRLEIMGELLGALNDDQPVNFLAMQDDIVGYQEYVRGPVEEFGANWDSATWYFDREADGRSVGGDWIAAAATDAESLYFPEIDDQPSGNRVRLALDGAYDIDENNEIAPLWLDISDTGDGQVFVCELRDNLEWGNGYGQMTAADWEFQIEEVHKRADIWDEETPPSTATSAWRTIENVSVTGELEFQLELTAPNPDFPFEPIMWAANCAPKELYESYAPDAESLRRSDEFTELQFSGNLGRFTFERWERSAEFVAVRNDDYYMQAHADEMGAAWVDAPYFDSFTYRVIEEQSTRVSALEQGEVTTAGVPPDRYDDMHENEDIDVYEVPQPFMTILAYNQRRNGWSQLRERSVRQALSYAVDKETIIDDIYRGLAEYSHTHQPLWSDWYVDEFIQEFGVGEAHDVARARELLEDGTSDDFGYE